MAKKTAKTSNIPRLKHSWLEFEDRQRCQGVVLDSRGERLIEIEHTISYDPDENVIRYRVRTNLDGEEFGMDEMNEEELNDNDLRFVCLSDVRSWVRNEQEASSPDLTDLENWKLAVNASGIKFIAKLEDEEDDDDFDDEDD